MRRKTAAAAAATKTAAAATAIFFRASPQYRVLEIKKKRINSKFRKYKKRGNKNGFI